MSGKEEQDVASRDPISKSVVDAGRRHIFYANKRGERFNITAVHRMNMHYLRKRIMDETMSILEKGEMSDGNSEALTSLIQDYCTVLGALTTPISFPCRGLLAASRHR